MVSSIGGLRSRSMVRAKEGGTTSGGSTGVVMNPSIQSFGRSACAEGLTLILIRCRPTYFPFTVDTEYLALRVYCDWFQKFLSASGRL